MVSRMRALRALAGGGAVSSVVMCQPSWTRSHNIEGEKVDAKVIDTIKGNALVATQNIRKNEIIIRVPNTALIEARDNKETTLAEKFLKSAEHAEYRASLPRAFYLPQSLDFLLEGTTLAGGQLHTRELYQIRPTGVIEKRWKWALDVVSTRSGFFGTDECLCLVPFICFANHSQAPNAEISRTDESVNLMATKDINAGEEVCISYGNLQTEQQLWTYGFFEGPFSIVCPYLDFSDDPKIEALQQLICVDSGATGPRLTEGGSEELKAWIGVSLFDDDALRRFIKKLDKRSTSPLTDFVWSEIQDDKVVPLLKQVLEHWRGALEKLRQGPLPGQIGPYVEQAYALVTKELDKL